MSLIKQLWIAAFCITALALGGSLVLSTLSARDYLVQELTVKNIDNASSLALTLSHADKDPVTVELHIAAHFDTGHYQTIRLLAPNGETRFERTFKERSRSVPDWFMRLIPLQTKPGFAQVQDGWKQFGTLTVISQDHYAYESLWTTTLRLLMWFSAGGLLLGALGSVLIKRIVRPLNAVTMQAQAIGERRFISIAEPSTLEFRGVVCAMNTLSQRVQRMLSEESDRLEALRQRTQHDEMTGLLTRTYFMRRLESVLYREDTRSGGVLIIARLGSAATLNLRLGRHVVDALIRSIGSCFQQIARDFPDADVGRLNGTDFALLTTGNDVTTAVTRQLRNLLTEKISAFGHDPAVALPMGAGTFSSGMEAPQLLARVDGALASAEQEGPHALKLAHAEQIALKHIDIADWRCALEQALAEDHVQLASYPVVSRDGSLLHLESPVRLLMDGNWQPAGYFMPWAARLNITGRIDEAVVRHAATRIQAEGCALAINLSAESLCDAGFRTELIALLDKTPEVGTRLWIEVPEYGVIQHPAEFRELCRALKPYGCHLGIEHVGRQLDHIKDLHDLGLDYIKVDVSIINGIEQDTGNQNVLRSLCTVAHSIGLLVIAEGVRCKAERDTLPLLGLDGMTGPDVRLNS